MSKKPVIVAKFDDFVRLTSFFYRSIGIQPYGGGGETTLLSSIIFYVNIVNMFMWLLAEIIYVLMALASGSHFLEATQTLACIGFVSVGVFKLLFVWWKRDILTDFMQQLEKLFPRNEAQQREMRLPRYLQQSNMVTFTFGLLYMVLIWTYNLYSLVEYFLYERWLGVRVVGKMLPYICYIPWNWQGHWSYYLLLFLQSLAGYGSAAGQIASDLLLCAVAMQVTMHYANVARRIREYGVKAQGSRGESAWERNMREKDMRCLKDIIAYHDRILNLSEIMNDIFGAPLLVNFMTSSFVICFLGFLVTIGTSQDILFKLFLFLFCSMAQVYLICHYGQLLIDASMSIAQAAYEQDWSHADVRFQKMLVLITQRAQKPALLKATNFLHVSRRTMTDIMQTSYKFFALLRTMYSNK